MCYGNITNVPSDITEHIITGSTLNNGFTPRL